MSQNKDRNQTTSNKEPEEPKKLPSFNSLTTGVDDELDPHSEQTKLAPLQKQPDGDNTETNVPSDSKRKAQPVERGFHKPVVSTEDALDNAVAEDAEDLEDIKRYRDEQEGE